MSIFRQEEAAWLGRHRWEGKTLKFAVEVNVNRRASQFGTQDLPSHSNPKMKVLPLQMERVNCEAPKVIGFAGHMNGHLSPRGSYMAGGDIGGQKKTKNQ